MLRTMIKNLSEKFQSNKNNQEEKQPLLSKKEKNAFEEEDFSKLKRQGFFDMIHNSKQQDDDNPVNGQPKKKRLHSNSNKRDPLQYGFYPYRSSLWGYAGFDSNLPKVFFPLTTNEEEKAKLKRRSR